MKRTTSTHWCAWQPRALRSRHQIVHVGGRSTLNISNPIPLCFTTTEWKNTSEKHIYRKKLPALAHRSLILNVHQATTKTKHARSAPPHTPNQPNSERWTGDIRTSPVTSAIQIWTKNKRGVVRELGSVEKNVVSDDAFGPQKKALVAHKQKRPLNRSVWAQCRRCFQIFRAMPKSSIFQQGGGSHLTGANSKGLTRC